MPNHFPQLWTNLEYLIDQRIIIASQAVLWELDVKHDEIWAWAGGHPMFVAIDEEIQKRVNEISDKYPNLVDYRSERVGADPFVIALAEIEGCTVVTGEIHGTSNRPKIPDVCDALGIRCIDIRQLIRDQGWTF